MVLQPSWILCWYLSEILRLVSRSHCSQDMTCICTSYQHVEFFNVDGKKGLWGLSAIQPLTLTAAGIWGILFCPSLCALLSSLKISNDTEYSLKSVKHLLYLLLESKGSWTILDIKFQFYTVLLWVFFLGWKSRFSQVLLSAYPERVSGLLST